MAAQGSAIRAVYAHPMTWTLTVDDKAITITDTEAARVQKELEDRDRNGFHLELTGDDGTELSIDSTSSVTLTHDG
jgi:hypothetical protein